MFSGIGGFEHGIEGIKAECVGFSEIDKYAVAIYKNHYPTHKNYGDAKKIVTEEIPPFELLVGGFPCQAFSVAGKQRGFCDTRGTLFFEIARVLTDKRPRNFLLENVKGLLSHDKGKTFQTILEILSDIGYRVEWQVLNSKDFGVPQNRERIFIIGHLRGTGGGTVFPLQRSDESNIGESRSKRKIEKIVNTGHDGTNIYDPNGLAVTQKALGGGQGAKTGLYAVPKQAIPVLCANKGPVVRQDGRRLKTNDEPSFTLNTIDRQGLYDGYRIRRLTPTECERLQGFPDGWTTHGQFGFSLKEISDSQRYKTLGNAVTTNVIGAIVTEMVKAGCFED